MTNTIESNTVPSDRCPSLVELAASLEAQTSSVKEHLAECLRCRTRLAGLKGTVADPELADLAPLPTQKVVIRNRPHRVRPDSKLELGAICSIASDERPGERLLVVIIGGKPVKDPLADGAVTVAPISIERHFAAGWDGLVDAAESALAYDHMIELWNYGQISRVQLDESFGSVHAAARTRLEKLWDAVRSGAEQAPDETKVGPAILAEEDPRIAFQLAESERVRAFYNPSVTYVHELAGLLVRLLQEKGAAAAVPVASADPHETEILKSVTGNGFITAPNGAALGRVISLFGLDVAPGTEGGVALEEEASAWIENEGRGPVRLAAHRAMARARDVFGRVIPSLGEREETSDEVAAYLATVRAAAQSRSHGDGAN